MEDTLWEWFSQEKWEETLELEHTCLKKGFGLLTGK